MITVVNKYTHTPTAYDIDISRRTDLGNPWSHKSDRQTLAKYVAESRLDAVKKYELWLTLKLDDPRSPQSAAFARIVKLAQEHDVFLVCYCAPRPCHGDFIKKLVENLIL